MRAAYPLAAALVLSGLVAAGDGGRAGSPAAARDATTMVLTASAPAGVTSVCTRTNLANAPCLAPHQFRVAYGIQPLLDQGIDGRGETVTILAPAPAATASAGTDVTDIRQDLAAFDTLFKLPAARIQAVTSLAGAAAPYQAAGAEEVGDFEILHTVAPAATLRVVLFPASWSVNAAHATTDMLAALRLAVAHTDVVSASWSLGEHYFTPAQAAALHAILLGAAAHQVTVVGSSGDNGAADVPRFGDIPVKEVSLPASDPLVLGVGGTTITANLSTGAYGGETAWAGGGGFSHLYARPAYQDGVPGIGRWRGVPDVAGDADQLDAPATVFAGGSIVTNGGTSNSAPLWAGLVALADQEAHHDLGLVNPTFYAIGRSARYHQAFHDITVGNNTSTSGGGGCYVSCTGTTVTIAGYQAAPGWDLVTGWGSPRAQVLVPLLAHGVVSGTP